MWRVHHECLHDGKVAGLGEVWGVGHQKGCCTRESCAGTVGS